jgi:hypothetical protein
MAAEGLAGDGSSTMRALSTVIYKKNIWKIKFIL